METFFNGKKVPVTPLWLGSFVSDFQEKANIFNSFFAKQCTLVSNNSVLHSEFTYMTEEHIHSVSLSESDVIKMIRVLDVNEAHGHDNISVRMIKLCTNSVAHPLSLIFQNSVAAGTFATKWKKANMYQSIRRMINKYQTIDQYLLCLYAVKVLKSLFSRNFSS